MVDGLTAGMVMAPDTAATAGLLASYLGGFLLGAMGMVVLGCVVHAMRRLGAPPS